MISRNNLLYAVLILGCVAGYGWLGFTAHDPHYEVTVCLVKNVTGFPCPSCGSTRAMVALWNGDLGGVIRFNPIGLLLAVVLLVAPWWVSYDLLTGRRTLAMRFSQAEGFMQQKWVAAPAIFLLLLNWLWTYSKNL